MTDRSPRLRRLETDYRNLQSLAEKCEVFSYEIGKRGEFNLPESYTLEFLGPSLMREGQGVNRRYRLSHTHQVQLTLGMTYPRTTPGLHWITPIFHPNISSGGQVCLGGYSTYWVPSLMIDQLCSMLWDMLTYRNFNLGSPFNTDAAQWLSTQRDFTLPLEVRALNEAKLPSQIDLPAKRSTSLHESCSESDIQFLEGGKL